MSASTPRATTRVPILGPEYRIRSSYVITPPGAKSSTSHNGTMLTSGRGWSYKSFLQHAFDRAIIAPGGKFDVRIFVGPDEKDMVYVDDEQLIEHGEYYAKRVGYSGPRMGTRVVARGVDADILWNFGTDICFVLSTRRDISKGRELDSLVGF